jgi:hypothetical protein
MLFINDLGKAERDVINVEKRHAGALAYTLSGSV